jgi:aminoglycoside phosphotransferase (APT) family kinase protein
MHSVEFAEPPFAISGGFETLIFAFRLAQAPPAFAGPLILRMFREADAEPRARFEASVHGAVAQLGYPAPAVRYWSSDASVLGGVFLILERLAGENLFARGVSPALLRLPKLLADAQLRLHALARTGAAHARSGGLPGRAPVAWHRARRDRRIRELARPRRPRARVAWLRATPARAGAAVVCHGGFHPLNVLAEAGASPASSTGRCGT